MSIRIVSIFLLLFSLLGSPVLPLYVFADEVENNGAVLEEAATNTEDEHASPEEAQEQEPKEEEQEEEDTASSSDSVIETGDAVSDGTIQNEVNTNTVDSENATSTESEGDEAQATSTSTETQVTASTTNQAQVDNTAQVEATTGNNTIATSSAATSGDQAGASTTPATTSGTSTASTTAINTASSTITTGNAVATANIVNVVNTNIFDSYGLFIFLMNLFNGSFNLDLRLFDFFTPPEAEPAASCTDGICGGTHGSATTVTSNTATVTNAVVVRADTGNNEIQGGTGTSTITTGSAYATANVINVANTNIVDSNYLLLTFNNIGDWGGDVVFPGVEQFTRFFRGPGECSDTVTTNNTANVDNTVTTQANTGNNSATSTNASSTIQTGSGETAVNVVNQVNTNIICNDSFSVLFRVHGKWSGRLFNAPEGVSWRETASGPQIWFGDEYESNEGNGTVENNNDASIFNNIEVTALTGENKIEGSGPATISTGNAYATANLVNVVNTNVIGRNWFLAIINIFGDWEGDISFGRPDLWIGGKAELPRENAAAGDEIEYQFTIMNNGDAPAHDVTLTSTDNNPYLLFTDYGSLPYEQTQEGSIWEVGDLDPGETKEVRYRMKVAETLPIGSISLDTTAQVVATERDENSDDNTEVLSVIAQRTRSGSQGGGREPDTNNDDTDRKDNSDSKNDDIASLPEPVLKLSKSASATSTVASSTIEYTVTIFNDSKGLAYNATLIDELTNEEGTVINRTVWDLGTILDEEEIKMTYTIGYSASTTPGIYTNRAWIEGYSSSGTFIQSSDASRDVLIRESRQNGIEVLSSTEPVETIQIAPLFETTQIEETLEETSVFGEVLGAFSNTPTVHAADTQNPYANKNNRYTNMYGLLMILAFSAGIAWLLQKKELF